MDKLQKILDKYPNLEVLVKDAKSLHRLDDGKLKTLAESVSQRLILPDEHLLPTSPPEIIRDFEKGNAIIIADRKSGQAVGFTAYIDRLTARFKVDSGLTENVSGMSELYCVVVDKEYHGRSIGTTIASELISKHYKETQDITSFITFQEQVVRLFRRASDSLKKDGLNISFRAFSGEELPMLYQFLTLANPKIMDESGKPRYTQEDIQRIEETNPKWKVEKGILTAVNRYLSGKSSARFDLDGVNMMFISNPEDAHRTNTELVKVYGDVNTLKEVLINIGFSI